ncbi:hypothetical protein GBA52_018069 [Prunus armeniaca]|nr:hypothetical protein GBA52_018069 [Prunus armeniaca]
MAKHPKMILYLDKVQELLKAFPTFTIEQEPWAENAYADAHAELVFSSSNWPSMYSNGLNGWSCKEHKWICFS